LAANEPGHYCKQNAYGYSAHQHADDALERPQHALSARISGQIKEVHVIEGQLVHANDVLVTIDPADYKIAEAQGQANLANALATAASSHWSVPITSITVQSTLDSAKTAVTKNAPTPEEIRKRAFEIHIERGGIHGCDLDDWLRAERELREKHNANSDVEPKKK
jgi:pyruvate/2-oxoglutarate dehydrogenase complex dihydrolipoamide acyltransferase (E2) component